VGDVAAAAAAAVDALAVANHNDAVAAAGGGEDFAAQVKQFRDELEAHKTKNQHLEGEIIGKQQQISRLEKALNSLSGDDETLREQLHTAQQELAHRNTAMNTLAISIHDTEQQLTATTAALAVYKCTECDAGNNMVVVVQPCKHVRLCSDCINNFEGKTCRQARCGRRLQKRVHIFS
jgi:chromosome segregation ATPase